MRERHGLSLNLGAWLLVATGLLAACGSGDRTPTLIVRGGTILTVNDQDESAQAMAIRDGLIVAVGSEAEVLALKGPRTEMIDLHGRVVLPGFVAAHEHPTLSAIFKSTHDLSGFKHKSNAEVWAALREAVAQTPKGDWVYAGGIDAILTPDLQVPMRQALDQIAPEHPVLLISQTLHSAWANTKAFEKAGVKRDTPDPGQGAFYERDSQGEFTGFIAETRAIAPFITDLKSPLKLFGRYEAALDGYLAQGFTSVASLGYNVPPLMARYVASKDLRPRLRQFFYLVEDELKYLPEVPQTDNPFFRIVGVKLWHDGSPYTGSMQTSAPYLDSPLARKLGIPPGSHGEAMISVPTLAEKIKTYRTAGWQVAIHSQGDDSNREVAAAIALAGLPPSHGPLVRVEHGVMMPSEVVQQFAALNVTPSFHINHILYYGDALRDAIIGSAAAEQLLPVRQASELGMHPTLHADSPMFPANGFSLMQTAITRLSSSGRSINPAQAISIQQALRAMTRNGAYQLGIAHQAGTLEAGKWADFQIVDRNPYAVPPQELSQLKTLGVFVAGRLSYGASSFAK
ncbi:amidohydrolase [Roseateles sp. PN1]|uniref:amidohydrolase n=1 Tax=Roseateles sp. PN1 TaxID=3137372 RepID=UPI0031394810